MLSQHWLLLLGASALLICQRARIAAEEYRVEFDTWPHSSSLYVEVGEYNYSTPAAARLRNWGSSWSADDPDGSEVSNQDDKSRTLVSLYIVAEDGSDSFDIDALSAGHLFSGFF